MKKDKICAALSFFVKIFVSFAKLLDTILDECSLFLGHVKLAFLLMTWSEKERRH